MFQHLLFLWEGQAKYEEDNCSDHPKDVELGIRQDVRIDRMKRDSVQAGCYLGSQAINNHESKFTWRNLGRSKIDTHNV
jgi:hypothetical protein